MYIFGYFNFGQKVVVLERRMFVWCWLLATWRRIVVENIEIIDIRIMDIDSVFSVVSEGKKWAGELIFGPPVM